MTKITSPKKKHILTFSLIYILALNLSNEREPRILRKVNL